ncbi:MAG: hypothetical protein EOP04_13980 [Proteobacteria bacterium]|nr:MAG: hypothetical protein EOP04_13980 [Pseudomonadota bacterium]
MSNAKESSLQNTAWLHDLARAEVHPEAERLLGLGIGHDPHQVVEESTIQFLQELRERFTEYSRLFNSYSESGNRFQETKIYSVAQTSADFMVYRNQIKLVVSNTAHGVISIQFTQHQRSPFQFDGANPEANATQSAQEILAQLGPFRDVHWSFQGEKVSPDQLAKFYFIEFVRSTREKRVQKGNNQLLLDQIKALLTEKGIDL